MEDKAPIKRPNPLFCRMLCGFMKRKDTAAVQADRQPNPRSISDSGWEYLPDKKNVIQLNTPTMTPATRVRSTSRVVETRGDIMDGGSGTGFAAALDSHCVERSFETGDADLDVEELQDFCRGKGGGMKRIEIISSK